jgi:drug/metabolite transporter (DMT)-like permease
MPSSQEAAVSMRFAFGMGATLLFASAGILERKRQRTRPDDDGVLMTVFVNVVVLGTVAAVMTWPTWDGAAMVSFLIGGVIGTVGGRTALLRGLRLIGPTRSSAFVTGAPGCRRHRRLDCPRRDLEFLEVLGGAIAISGLCG